MKKLISFAIAVLMVASASAQVNYKLVVKADGSLEGKKVTVTNLSTRAVADSAEVKSGEAVLSGTIDAPEFASVAVEGVRTRSIVVLEDGVAEVKFAPEAGLATGTPNNDALSDYLSGLNKKLEPLEKIMEAAENATGEQEKELQKQYLAVQNEVKEYSFEACKKLADKLIPAYIIRNNMSQFSDEQMDVILALDGQWKANGMAQYVINFVNRKKATAAGQQFTDFEMLDINGEVRHLSDYVGKGKYVLIDFWASWCGPCRRELPNVVKAYAEFKDKGLEIVGVSLDKDGDNWRKAVKDLNLTWIHLSDLQYWQCLGAKLYAVNSIPATVLVDPEGKIIARNLRGPALAKKFAELMK